MKLPNHIGNRVLDMMCNDDGFAAWHDALPPGACVNLERDVAAIIAIEMAKAGVVVMKPASEVDA